MRLIDADELLKDSRQNKAIGACLADIVDIMRLVDDQPTIDAVPVVRCGVCLFRDTENPEWCHAHMSLIQLDGFCNYGRPRDAE